MRSYCLLTGGTGLVGRYLVRDLLMHEEAVAVLIRSRGDESPAHRLEQVLAHWDRELGRNLPRRVRCLEGDVTLPGLGLSNDDRRWVATHCPRMLHNAASLDFHGKDRTRDPWLSNYTGTENVLDLCRLVGIRELHYVSTAYVCGKREELARENELECGQEFRNDYEECKYEAEKLVRAADFIENLTVYRPAIITGDSLTGYTSTYHGLYSYLHFPHLVMPYLERDDEDRPIAPIRLNLTGNERRNLVPVDWVSAVMTKLLINPRHHGKTYHLTPTVPTTARTIEQAMRNYYNYVGVSFAGHEPLKSSDLNDVETGFYEQVARYQPYWSQEPRFDRHNLEHAVPDLPCPPIDQAGLRRMLEFAVRDNWGKKRRIRRKAKVS